ncbi:MULTISPECIES: 16S rRNA (guanine(527)-N(7))-methyltransferase RsmG [unclassified Aureimonas]|uniref:16S rRNA (guanine(527)-N(7))-methyltransferase RsmG n=1 Tax=unclassified Aureimonas TaxID=2615206 RepID=UPI0007816560|nr:MULTISPECIES: 16S rRNA (guanine(527)-N(7))-methyltransferase RsmG [unclassified Aureimonas]
MRKQPERSIRPFARTAVARPASRPRMGRAATDAKLAEERSLVLSRHGVSRETVEKLDAYVELLRTWQTRINLISPSTIPEIWTRHLEDGLWLSHLARNATRWVDLGSGAGFPGLVLAITLCGREGAEMHLVESNAKKAAFLRTVIRELSLPAEVHVERIEDCGEIIGGAEAVSARALASLDELCALVAPHLKPDAKCWFPKGRNHDEEIAAASAHWRFDMVKHSSEIEDGSVMLEIRRLEALAGA